MTTLQLALILDLLYQFCAFSNDLNCNDKLIY